MTPDFETQDADDLEDLFENAPCGYASALPNGRISKVNRTLATWLGHTNEHLVGRRFLDLLNIAGKVYYETHFAPLLRMQGFFNEVALDLMRADGTTLPVLVNAVVRRDEGGDIRFIRITVFNASDRRRYEREMLEARRAAERATAALQDLNATLEGRVADRARALEQAWRLSPDLLAIADGQGTFLAVNAAWKTLLGWEVSDLVGQSFVGFTHPDDLDATQAALGRVLTAPMVKPYEYRLKHADGTYRRFSWTGVFENGQIYATGRNTTAEYEQAAALSRAEEALRQSQKLEAVGQLTGGVAHDFNNLLTIIRSSVDFLRRPDLPEERRARYMDAVSDTVDRAAKLTSQLLAFARRQTLKPEVFDVGDRLRGIADMLDTVTGARIRVVTAIPDLPCFVKADVSQFETALINMAVNARDAMDGAGTLTLRLDDTSNLPSIRGHAAASGQFASISLTDTGTGIAPDQIGRIFEPFFTTKEVGKGTGLGLSQVFGFAKQSGGDIEVESERGRGTTFTLYLPMIAAVAFERPASAIDGETFPTGDGQSVLVVEDNVEVGRFATQILEDIGYHTTWAANAEDALDKLGADGAGFDAVFSDVVMPGMGGIELAKTLQRRMPALPVLLTSGYSHVLAQDGLHGFELLHKPYSADQLGRILGRVLPRGGKDVAGL
ncbi:PAS domain S-box protein [Methylobacterium sp. P1-11]|uniref:PAS domain S-box protein n=1 Tax=Methylobacterium sp. P1-11 TaxID=2024616 RepID=UPI0011EE563C|nr:PAS domain S-box protein [Methylobacterium sp. P1-11]KAA0115653.1 PAS domain S-box protein [Methylobacterium sp. P1-11]